MPKSRGKISLEDLLKAKRLGKPSDGFWEKFERDLQRKERRLLQKQPVEDLEMEIGFWARFKRTTAIIAATASTGTLGLILITNFSISSLNTASISEEGELVSATPSASPVLIESAKQTFKEFETVGGSLDQPVFEVASKEEPIGSISQKDEIPVQREDALLASTEVEKDFAAPIPEETWNTESTVSFVDFDIQTATASNDYIDYTGLLLSKYQHPLSDKGYAYGYDSMSVGKRTPLDRITSMAIESNLLEEDSRWGLKLDTVTLKF